MERLRVFVIKNACPLCGGDVVGNENVDYYCKHCNMLFKLKDLRKEAVEEFLKKRERDKDKGGESEGRKEEIRGETKAGMEEEGKRKIVKVYDKKPERLPVEIPVERPSVSQQNLLFVASKHSNKFHIQQCPFARNIKEENKVFFSSKQEALNKGFKPCKCVED